jgi:hypothetical protein
MLREQSVYSHRCSSERQFHYQVLSSICLASASQIEKWCNFEAERAGPEIGEALGNVQQAIGNKTSEVLDDSHEVLRLYHVVSDTVNTH